MKDCSLGDPPIAKGDKFSLNQYSKNELEQKEMEKFPYGLIVGSLMYAQVCTHLDITYIVGMLGTYLSNPGMDHWKAAKWVMRYLQSEVLYNDRLSTRSDSSYPEVKKIEVGHLRDISVTELKKNVQEGQEIVVVEIDPQTPVAELRKSSRAIRPP